MSQKCFFMCTHVYSFDASQLMLSRVFLLKIIRKEGLSYRVAKKPEPQKTKLQLRLGLLWSSETRDSFHLNIPLKTNKKLQRHVGVFKSNRDV